MASQFVFQTSLIVSLLALVVFTEQLLVGTARQSLRQNVALIGLSSIVACGFSGLFVLYEARVNAVLLCSLIVICCALMLYRPTQKRMLACGLSLIAAMLFCLIYVHASSFAISILLPASAVLLPLSATRHRLYRNSSVVREDGLLIVLALALMVGVMPSLEQGWHTAKALNVGLTTTDATGEDKYIPIELLFVAVIPLLVGALVSWWQRRSRF